MRSFKRSGVLVVPLIATIALLTGCPSDDTDDGYICGDNVCEVNDGENQFNCSEDCASEDPCGDGFCSPNDGENASNCPEDCQSGPVCGNGSCENGENSSSCPGDCPANSCTGTSFPVDCHDGTGCWSSGTNCSSNVFVCNGARRCANTAGNAFCCANVFVECPGFAPFFCPQDGLCYQGGTVPAYCNVSACSLILGDC